MDGGRESAGRRLGKTAPYGGRRHSYLDESAAGNLVIIRSHGRLAMTGATGKPT
jgi:hypothetical protein